MATKMSPHDHPPTHPDRIADEHVYEIDYEDTPDRDQDRTARPPAPELTLWRDDRLGRVGIGFPTGHSRLLTPEKARQTADALAADPEMQMLAEQGYTVGEFIRNLRRFAADVEGTTKSWVLKQTALDGGRPHGQVTLSGDIHRDRDDEAGGDEE